MKLNTILVTDSSGLIRSEAKHFDPHSAPQRRHTHASLNTTNRYASVNIEMKRKAIAQVKTNPRSPRTPWKNNTTLEWPQSLSLLS
jgi:hypothetical protein